MKKQTIKLSASNNSNAVENKKRSLFLLLAGSNGAGKSTFVKDNAFKKFLDILRKRFNISSLEPYQIINPDIIFLSRLMINPEIDEKTANLWSVQEIEKSIGKYFNLSKSFAIETVLSSKKYKIIAVGHSGKISIEDKKP